VYGLALRAKDATPVANGRGQDLIKINSHRSCQCKKRKQGSERWVFFFRLLGLGAIRIRCARRQNRWCSLFLHGHRRIGHWDRTLHVWRGRTVLLDYPERGRNLAK
jgi:hypothetical protein